MNERETVQLLTVEQLHLICRAPMEVRSGYNGKILAKKYNPKKHEALADRIVSSVWPEMRVRASSGFRQFMEMIVCVYVAGDVEYAEEHPHCTIISE